MSLDTRPMFTLTGKCIEYDEEGSNTKKRKTDDTSDSERLAKKRKERAKSLSVGKKNCVDEPQVGDTYQRKDVKHYEHWSGWVHHHPVTWGHGMGKGYQDIMVAGHKIKIVKIDETPPRTIYFESLNGKVCDRDSESGQLYKSYSFKFKHYMEPETELETSSQRLKKIEELERKLAENEYLLKKLKQDKLRLEEEAKEAAKEAAGLKTYWTMKRVKKIILNTSDRMMLKEKDQEEIVKFISESMISGKKLSKVKINAQGYAIPYLVRDIVVKYLIHHCAKLGLNAFRGKTPTYWMTVIGEAFKKLPFKFWDVDEEEVMKFRPVCDDEDGRLKTKVKNKEQLTTEQQVLLHSCSMTWNYTLPSSYGVFMLGMGIDFVDPINDILRPRGVLVYCSAAAFRCGSEYELCCGYEKALDSLV